MIEAEKFSSMIAAIQLGMTEERAVEKGLLQNDEERESWRQLVVEIREINAAGGVADEVSGTWF